MLLYSSHFALHGFFHIPKGTPGATSQGTYKEVDIYDPKTDTWRFGPDMPLGLHGTYPTVHDGKILVPGGCPQTDRFVSTYFVIYSP